MLTCLRSLRRDTSLMAVQGAPSSCSSLISFRATSFPVILCVGCGGVGVGVGCGRYGVWGVGGGGVGCGRYGVWVCVQ